jgi:hypothetical protein
MYQDILYDGQGRLVLQTDRQSNLIVTDLRRLLAGFMRGSPTVSLGIQGLRVGAGLSTWDNPPGPTAPSPGITAMADTFSFLVPRTDLQFTYLAGSVVSATPTNRLQIVATLGPGVPSWPDANHTSSTLREFGLAGKLDGTDILLNYVIHPAIAKDPFSTLVRTIWLVF